MREGLPTPEEHEKGWSMHHNRVSGKWCKCGHSYGVHWGFSTKRNPCHALSGCSCQDFEREEKADA